MFNPKHFSTWLFLWSIAYFLSRGFLPSPFATNAVVIVIVLVSQASFDIYWRRFLFMVLVHLFPLILTLPPRMTVLDGATNAMVLAAYCLVTWLMGDNVSRIYTQYRENILGCDAALFPPRDR